MNDEMKARFKALGSFPSPPGIAQEIITLAKNPEAGIGEVTGAISKDPALAAKVLRLANSVLYSQRRRSQNLRQALTIMGLDAAMTLCLGFSIAGSFRSAKSGTIDYTRYWRRSLLAGLGGRCFGEELGLSASEDLFLAGLLQDIGVLALDRAKPGFYAELPRAATHDERIAYERERLGEDHAAVGGWLLSTWNLPEDLVAAVELSHAPEAAEQTTERGRFVRCAALGGELATVFLAKDRPDAISRLSANALRSLGLGQEQLARVIDRVAQLTPDFGQLFETTILTPEDAMLLTEQAQEILAIRSVKSLHEIDTLKHTASALAARSEQFEDDSRRDALTGVFNRRHLDERLAAEFSAAQSGGWGLAVLFVDLDHFKRVNDTYGHAAGDAVLRGTADLLKKILRAEDVVARYGGEEFVVLLPGATAMDARWLGERVLAELRQYTHRVSTGPIEQDIEITASVGLAMHTVAQPQPSASALMAAADAAVYAAKRGGRDCVVQHGQTAATSLAQAG